jgi:hypothetical protein
LSSVTRRRQVSRRVDGDPGGHTPTRPRNHSRTPSSTACT